MSSLFRSTAIVSAGTAASRVLGFIREVLMAVFFGTSLAKSAFDVAFKVPNLFRRLFGEGALSAAFIPVFTATLEQEGVEEANRLACRVATMLAASLAAVVVGGLLLCLAAMQLLPLGEKAAAVLPLLSIMMPYVLFICLVALCMGILNAFHHFTVPALTPVLLNLVWISTLLLVCPRLGDAPAQRIYGVAWGILLAGLLQLAAQAPALWRHGVRLRPVFHWGDEKVRRVLMLMGPAALGMGVHQVNVVVDGLLALWVGTWAPAALTYAERLIYLPLGVFATALGTVLLPTFSRQAARAEPEEMRRTLGAAMRNLMLLMCPAAVGLMALATPIVRLAFLWEGGRFDAASTVVTARALLFYGPGLVVFSLYKILVPVFYAQKDTRTPVRVGVVMVGVNLVLNIVFILTWPAGYRHAGLAAATVFSSGLNCLVLAVLLRRRIGDPGWRALYDVTTRALLASLIMGIAAAGVERRLSQVLDGVLQASKLSELAAVLGGILAGLLVYGALVSVLCRSEVAAILRRMRR